MFRKRRNSFADKVHRALVAGYYTANVDDMLLDRLATFADNAKVELYAGDIRETIRHVQQRESEWLDKIFVLRRDLAKRPFGQTVVKSTTPLTTEPIGIRRSLSLLVLVLARRIYQRKGKA